MKNHIKKAISILLSIIIVISLFAVIQVGASAAVPAWKTAYVNYVNSVKSNKYGLFKLYDFDNNGIPELIYDSTFGYGGTINTFYNGKISTVSFDGDGYEMIYGDKIYISSGRMGSYPDMVYKYNGYASRVFDGLKVVSVVNGKTSTTYRYKTSGSTSYQYVSQYQYENKLLSIFNKNKATKLTKSNCCNASQIISAINNYNSTPAAPTISVANGVNGLDVAWGKTANTQSYVVYYKTAASGWSSFSTSSTRSTIKNVQSGKFYYVQVQSIGANGVKGNYSKVKTMTHLSRAGITSLTYNGNNTLKIKAVPGANKYQIARLKSGDKSYTYFYTTSTTFTEKNVGGGIAYTYQVRAMYQTAKNGTAYSAWSATKSVPTLVAPTVTLSNKSNGIRVTWNSIRGAVRYIVYYKKSIDKNWSSAVTTNLYYPILNAQRGATYYVQVRPVGSTVSTPYSSVKSIVH